MLIWFFITWLLLAGFPPVEELLEDLAWDLR